MKTKGIHDKKRTFACLAAAVLLLAVCLLFPGRAEPDFGGFAGDNDYGGRGYDGGGYGGGWDGGSTYSGSYYFSDDSGMPEIVAAIVVLFILYQAIASSKKPGRSRGQEEQAVGAPELQRAALRPMSDYLRLDPSFNEAGLREQLANLYVQMQECWREKDISSLRPWMTDAFYNQMERQLEALRRARRTDHTERIAVLEVRLLGFRQAGGMDCVTARLKTRIVTYILDDATGRLVSGHRDREKFMEYEWDLVRKTGSRTRKAGGVRAETCPHCGAPLPINASAKCAYCDSVVMAANDAWAVSAIRGISQRTA